jgi:sugar phosphate isomerase/epimerase
VGESFENKEKSSLTIDQLIAMAHRHGYEALCMRASQVGVHSPKETIVETAARIHAAGLRVSMVTGDFAVPRNDDQGPGLLRNIGPYLDLAGAFGANLIRVCMKTEDDIAWARSACDQASAVGIRLAHQSHTSSIFETVDGALRTIQAVGRPNFGLIYEPANWMIAGEDYGPAAIRSLAPHILNVYVQNHAIRPGGKATQATWNRGPVRIDHIGLWETGGVDSPAVFGALKKSGYAGYVTVHQAFQGVMSEEDAVRKSAEYLRPLL